jgi:glycosyltransferase involved in cell wall biosynthesis
MHSPECGVPTATLIVTTYDWPQALNLTLRSVARQSTAPCEVIVADDGSGPETRQLIRHWQSASMIPLLHVWQKNEGFRLARSRNRAIAAARGQYIILVDGDMVLNRHFVADHLQLARPGVFIQGCRLLTRAATARYMLDTGTLDVGLLRRGIERRRHALRSRILSRWFSRTRTDQKAIRGCNQAYWRADLVRVNGFDERMVGWGREDNEIAARLYNVGLARRNVKFMALATHLYHPVRHPPGATGNDALLQETVAQRRTWCEHGLSQHLPSCVA